MEADTTLAARERQFGPQHPETADAVYNAALARRGAGALGPAAELFERAAALYSHLYGEAHQSTLRCESLLQSADASSQDLTTRRRRRRVSTEWRAGPRASRVAPRGH